jgi:hypothetical protein
MGRSHLPATPIYYLGWANEIFSAVHLISDHLNILSPSELEDETDCSSIGRVVSLYVE